MPRVNHTGFSIGIRKRRDMNKKIRIGTRDSQLALWQAVTIQNKLTDLGYETTIVPLKATGDLDQEKPLYEMGIVGVFTRTLDAALIRDKIDIAVHSMKDVPTALPKGIIQTAVIERGASKDILAIKEDTDLTLPCTIATSSLRRKAQWLNRFPQHKLVPLRGNVNTRLKKLFSENWQGAVFAKAGLERIGKLPNNYMELDWMLPAPAQGAVVVVAQKNNDYAIEATRKLNDENTFQTTHAERMFLRSLEGGCSAPIAALAQIKEDEIHFEGSLFSLNGKTKLQVNMKSPIEEYAELGQKAADDILNRGGQEMIKVIHKETARLQTT